MMIVRGKDRQRSSTKKRSDLEENIKSVRSVEKGRPSQIAELKERILQMKKEHVLNNIASVSNLQKEQNVSFHNFLSGPLSSKRQQIEDEIYEEQASASFKEMSEDSG